MKLVNLQKPEFYHWLELLFCPYYAFDFIHKQRILAYIYN